MRRQLRTVEEDRQERDEIDATEFGRQVHALLAGGIQGILRSLQLALQALQNLQIGRQLPGHFSHMLPFELTDSVFLVCQIFPCGFQLVLEELSRIFRLLLAHFKILIDEQIG